MNLKELIPSKDYQLKTLQQPVAFSVCDILIFEIVCIFCLVWFLEII